MDSPTRRTSPAAPDRPDLTETLHNTTIDKTERNEFSNTANGDSAVPTGAGQADCVSLENNSLAESSHPTLLADDHSPEPAAIPLALPHELVECIILLLDTRSILKCRLINREFNAIIQSSTSVQYNLACKAAGVIDNPKSPLPYAERLEALKKREAAWRKLKPVFERTSKVIGEPSWSTFVHELTAGYYFLSNENWKDLYYCYLPSSPQDNPQWFSILGNGPGQRLSGTIADMGMAIYEHDLVVNVISSEVENQADMQRYSLDLVLLKFSTGEYHPLAHRQLVHVQGSPSARPYTIVRIVGDNLALLVYDQDGSQLFIFDWKTGNKRLQHKATGGAYDNSIPVFVSPELLLVPDRILSRFEVWKLFPSHPNSNTPVQILSIQIPAVSVDYFISSIFCHGELSPFLQSMPYFPPRPFFPSPENSIITINLLLWSPPGLQIAYKLIVHRSALLEMIKKWTSPSLLEQEEDLPTWLTNQVTVHKVADPDNGLVRLAARSELVSTRPHPASSPRARDSPTSQVSSTPNISADSSSSSISLGLTSTTSRYNILQVQWVDWGPPISRWLPLSDAETSGFCQSTGQRYVFLEPSPRDKRKHMVCVADFNPYNVGRNAETMARLTEEEGEHNGGNGNNGEEELEILDHKGMFSEEVYMGLKCVVYHAPGEYDFDGVLIDEERLLGLKRDSENRLTSINVLYIG